MGHVIYPTPSTSTSDSSGPQINYKDIPNLRLVQKSWLISTSRILYQNRHSLYHLHNQNNVRLFVANAEEHKKLIKNFIRTITRTKRLEPLIPTFRLDLICAFFVPENHKILSDLLEKCGTGLVSLNMVIPKSCTMPFMFPPFLLQSLQQLTIEFAGHSHNDTPDDEINPSFQANPGVTYFIQQLMNSARELHSVEVKCCSSPGTDSSVIPFGFGFLKVPPTVTTLLLRGPFSPDHLEITVPMNQRAHLTTLQIRASAAAPFLNENTIYKVLERHGRTIKMLKLSGGKHFPRSQINQQPPSLFKMPSMKNLETLSLTSINWLCVNKFAMTSVNFPKLTSFQMKGISVTLFESITAEARRLKTSLKSVENLEIWLVNRQFGFTVTLNLERMQRVHKTFQTVTNLDITICGMETCGLKYIFREMDHLKSLSIKVRHNMTGGGNLSTAGWDGLFIGVPECIAKGLLENPDYWQYFQGETGYDNNPSILNLKGKDHQIFYESLYLPYNMYHHYNVVLKLICF